MQSDRKRGIVCAQTGGDFGGSVDRRTDDFAPHRHECDGCDAGFDKREIFHENTRETVIFIIIISLSKYTVTTVTLQSKPLKHLKNTL